MSAKIHIFATMVAVVLLLAGSAFAESDYPLVDELFALTEDQIDIGIVALKLAKEVYPDLDVEAYSKKIDGLVDGARALTSYRTDPDYKVRALNTLLYKHYKLEYDFTDPTVKKLSNKFLNGTLDTKKGSCVTMPMLYLAVAQRLGYPVYPVGAPSHFFLRYVDQDMKLQNIEATGGGGYSPDSNYIESLEITQKSIKSGAYMRTMTYREYVGDLIAQNAIYWAQKGDLMRGLYYIDHAIQMNPTNADNYIYAGQMYMKASRRSIQPFRRDYYGWGDASFRRAEELGFIKLDNTNYIEQISKREAEYKKAMGGVK